MAALPKQVVPIRFWKGIDTKTDPFQVPLDRFLELNNSQFDKGGLLQKRNGFGHLSQLIDQNATYLTTFKNNLTAIGSNLQAFAQGSNEWIAKGSLQPIRLSTMSLVKSNTNQSFADSVIASNGFICTAYVDNIPDGLVNSPSVRYVITDSETGQNIINPVEIVPTSGIAEGSPRVFLLGNYFIIVFTRNDSNVFALEYIAIPVNDPSSPIAAANISTAYTPSSTVNFDGIVANSNLYLAWNGNDMGNAVHLNYIDAFLNIHSPSTYATQVATIMSVTADISGSSPIIYASYYDSGSQDGFTLAVSSTLATILTPTQTINGEDVANITSVATDGVCEIIYEINNEYSYDSAILTNYIKKNTITQAGVLGSAETVIRSVGLASKAFRLDDIVYFLSIYYSPFQPTYFLANDFGEVVSKLAYSNAGSYYTVGLPSVSMSESSASISYLIKDLIEGINKNNDAASAAGVYTQTGINLIKFNLSTEIISAEIGNGLHISGGFMWLYDGFIPVEHGFWLWPDSVEAEATADIAFTADTTNGSKVLTNVSSIAGLQVGMIITGVGIAVGSVIVSIDSSTQITLDQNATVDDTAVALTASGEVGPSDYFYQVTYEWSDNQGNIHRGAPSIPVKVTTTTETMITLNIPTLRLTYKLDNPVKIVIYRWSTANPIFYQVTSTQIPLLNDPEVDSIEYVDLLSDDDIIGNNIIYTTGGVLENIAAPATDSISLFDNRLFLINAENRNELLFSKQVIQNVPVETSDLLSMFVSPTIGAQGSTGVMEFTAPLDDKLIIFKKDAIYYINGSGPDNTGANNQYSQPVFITATVGSQNQKSVVFIPNGLMFESDKGIWLLGRDLSTQYIGSPVESYTQNSNVLSALNIPETNQVRFTLDNGLTLMYDYFYGQWSVFRGISNISSTIYQGVHTYLNSFGRIFQETPGLYLDGSAPVLMSFKSAWVNLAGLQGLQRSYWFYLLGTYLSPHKLQIGVAYDYEISPSQTLQLEPDNYSPRYGGETIYGGGDYGGASSLESWRIFLQRQKCESFQISINEVYDSTKGQAAGAGLTLSGLDLTVSAKKGYNTLKPSRSIG